MLTCRLRATREKIEEQLRLRDDELTAAQSEKSGVSETVASLEAELKAKSDAHDKLAAKADEDRKALEAKLAKLSAHKDKLEAEISEGAEEAEKSMRVSSDLEDKVQELEDKVDALSKDLEAERQSRQQDTLAWEKERGASADKAKAGEEALASSQAAAKTTDKDLSVSCISRSC